MTDDPKANDDEEVPYDESYERQQPSPHCFLGKSDKEGKQQVMNVVTVNFHPNDS